MSKLLLSLTLLLCSLASSAKILIFTCSYNRPDFIEIQHKTLAAFLEDEYEYVVFDDSRDPKMTRKMKATCDALGVRYVKVPQAIHDRPYLPRLPGEDYNHPTIRNVNVVQYFLNTLGFEHDDIVVLLDSDIFLVKPFNIREFMRDYDMVGAASGNGFVRYVWHVLAFLDMRTLPNRHTLTFNCGRIDGKPVDGGGHSYYYLRDNPEIKFKHAHHISSHNVACQKCRAEPFSVCSHNTELLKRIGMNDPQIEFMQSAHNVEFHLDHTFMHYRGGTNWNGQSDDYHLKKTIALNRYLGRILFKPKFSKREAGARTMQLHFPTNAH